MSLSDIESFLLWIGRSILKLVRTRFFRIVVWGTLFCCVMWMLSQWVSDWGIRALTPLSACHDIPEVVSLLLDVVGRGRWFFLVVLGCLLLSVGMYKCRSTQKNPEPVDLTELDPCLDCSEDRCGRARFALAVLYRIIKSDVPVVGLIGEWGIGKTSVINMMKELLQAGCAWCDKKEPSGSEVNAVRLKYYYSKNARDTVLAFVSDENVDLTSFRNVQIVHFSCVDVVYDGGIAAAMMNTFAEESKGTDRVLSTCLELFSKCIDTGLTAEILKGINKAEQVFGMSARQRLESALRQQSQTYIVVIDDIERLLPDEALRLLKDLRTICRLPHVRYLISYDEKELARNIGIAQGVSGDESIEYGRRFLEKWIPLYWVVPASDVWSWFCYELDDIRNDYEPECSKSSEVLWTYRELLCKMVRNPRDVRRLLKKIRLSFMSLYFYVDVADFVLVKALELFDGGAYNFIHETRNELLLEENSLARGAVSKAGHENFNTEIRRQHRDRVNDSFKGSESQKSFLTKVLDTLFAPFRLEYTQQPSVFHKRSITSSPYFNVYFREYAEGWNVLSYDERQKIDSKFKDDTQLSEFLDAQCEHSTEREDLYLLGKMRSAEFPPEENLRVLRVLNQKPAMQDKIYNHRWIHACAVSFATWTSSNIDVSENMKVMIDIIERSSCYCLLDVMLSDFRFPGIAWMSEADQENLLSVFYLKIQRYVRDITADADLQYEVCQNHFNDVIGRLWQFYCSDLLSIMDVAFEDEQNPKRVMFGMWGYFALLKHYAEADQALRKCRDSGKIKRLVGRMKVIYQTWVDRQEELWRLLECGNNGFIDAPWSRFFETAPKVVSHWDGEPDGLCFGNVGQPVVPPAAPQENCSA